jgi:hypothetical protein
MKTRFPLVILIFGLLACSKENSPTPGVVSIADLLPRENEISSWARKSGSDASWAATNTSELQQRIDGGFELFSNHGFVEAAMQQYMGTVNSQSNIDLEIQIYNQNSQQQADAVFDDPNNIFPNPITPINPPSTKAQIRKDIYSFTMKFTKAKYYVLVTIMSNDDKAQAVLEVFASNVASKIK